MTYELPIELLDDDTEPLRVPEDEKSTGQRWADAIDESRWTCVSRRR